MAKILSFSPNSKLENESPLKSLWEEFISLDKFTRLFIISYIFIITATPFIVANYQIFYSNAESDAERLKEIVRIQEFQQHFTDFSSSTAQVTGAPAATQKPAPSVLENIFNFFKNGINLLLKIPSVLFPTPK